MDDVRAGIGSGKEGRKRARDFWSPGAAQAGDRWTHVVISRVCACTRHEMRGPPPLALDVVVLVQVVRRPERGTWHRHTSECRCVHVRGMGGIASATIVRTRTDRRRRPGGRSTTDRERKGRPGNSEEIDRCARSRGCTRSSLALCMDGIMETFATALWSSGYLHSSNSNN
jgi:hypothetical protein